MATKANRRKTYVAQIQSRGESERAGERPRSRKSLLLFTSVAFCLQLCRLLSCICMCKWGEWKTKATLR